ncbi:MAG: hypothetical protein M0P01_12370 [Treponema sp.]|nr:hypothetical protein [Treponema sp.]
MKRKNIILLIIVITCLGLCGCDSNFKDHFGLCSIRGTDIDIALPNDYEKKYVVRAGVINSDEDYGSAVEFGKVEIYSTEGLDYIYSRQGALDVPAYHTTYNKPDEYVLCCGTCYPCCFSSEDIINRSDPDTWKYNFHFLIYDKNDTLIEKSINQIILPKDSCWHKYISFYINTEAFGKIEAVVDCCTDYSM